MTKFVVIFYLITSLKYICSSIENRDELLKLDASLWPGHLEPFGSKQNKKLVKELHEWPSPQEFFTEYIDKNEPVLFKKVVLDSPAYKLFNDEFLSSFPDADTTIIYAEPEKKENRTKRGFDMSFKEFIERYHKESLYMVNALPMQLRKYVKMPPPLRCNETRPLMSSQVTWFSSGGTKSVIHNDDVDNINCLYRGSKQLIFVDYNKYKKLVPIDHPEGSYSSIDVDKVDYVKFPELRYIEEYIEATMEEGDCLFIPYHWYHQVNSKANKDGQNLAVNVWFKHVTGHKPQQCDIKEDDCTLDKYLFSDDDEEERGEEGGEGEEGDYANSHVGHFEEYVKHFKKPLKLKTFVRVLLKDNMINREDITLKKYPSDMVQIAKEMFTKLDLDNDGVLSMADFDVLRKTSEEELMNIEFSLTQDTARLEDLFEDVMEQQFQEERQNEAQSRATDEL